MHNSIKSISVKQMDYSQLLFAAEVRKLAVTIGNAVVKDYKATIENEPDREALLDAWFEQNPLSTFIPKAFNELSLITETIESMQQPSDAQPSLNSML